MNTGDRTSVIRPSYISPSAVKSYLSCPLRFYFERVVQIRNPTSVALHVGKVIHATLQSFNLARWRDEDSSRKAMKTAFDKYFSELNQEDFPKDYSDQAFQQKTKDCAWNTVDAYFSSPEADTNEKPLGVELTLEMDIPGLPIPVRGAIDLIKNDLTPVDYKSSAAKPNREQAVFDHELQLVTYQMMVEQATGKLPPALELIYLVKTKTPAIEKIELPPANKTRKQRVSALYRIAYTGITDEKFYPCPGMHCSWCSFKGECLKWAP